MKTAKTHLFFGFVAVTLLLHLAARASRADVPVTLSDIRVEWKEKSIGDGKGKLYMKLLFNATVNAALSRGEEVRAAAECSVGGMNLVDDHGSALLYNLQPGQTKAQDFPIFISNPLSSRPDSCNLTFRFGKSSRDSVKFASYCVHGSSVGPGACDGASSSTTTSAAPTTSTSSTPVSTGNVPVTVGNVRLEWKQKTTGDGKGNLYMKLYFDANVHNTVNRGEEIRAAAVCRMGGANYTDDHGGGLLSEVAPGQTKALDFPIFISSPLASRPESCNLTFSFGKTSRDRVNFATFCYNGATLQSGSCS